MCLQMRQVLLPRPRVMLARVSAMAMVLVEPVPSLLRLLTMMRHRSFAKTTTFALVVQDASDNRRVSLSQRGANVADTHRHAWWV